MIRRSEEKQTVRKPAPFNGVGEITVRSLLNGPEEMSQKGRVFGHTTVYPGSEIGYHIHTSDSETYYILSGKGLYNDNGTEVEIRCWRRDRLRPRRGPRPEVPGRRAGRDDRTDSVRMIHHKIVAPFNYIITQKFPCTTNMNCTPFVRQYGILSNKWGVFLCQKEYQTNDIRRNSKNW